MWRKRNVAPQTRTPSSVSSWSSPDAHLSVVGGFGGGQRSAWAGLHQTVMLCDPAWTLSYIGSLLDQTTQASLHPCINEPWLLTTVPLVPCCSFLGPLFDWPCRPGTAHRTCSFRDEGVTVWPFVKLAHIFTLVCFSCFTHQLRGQNVHFLPDVQWWRVSVIHFTWCHADRCICTALKVIYYATNYSFKQQHHICMCCLTKYQKYIDVYLSARISVLIRRTRGPSFFH